MNKKPNITCLECNGPLVQIDDSRYQDEFCSVECKTLNTTVMLLLRKVFRHLAALSARLQNFVRIKYDLWDEEERKIYLVVYAILSLIFFSLLINYTGYSDDKLLCSLSIIAFIPIWLLKGLQAVAKAILLCTLAVLGLIILPALYSFIANTIIPICFGIVGLVIAALELDKLFSNPFVLLGAFIAFMMHQSTKLIVAVIESNRCCKKFHDD